MKKSTNFKKWSFRLLMYLIIINVAIAYLVINYMVGFHDPNIFNRNVLILSMVANLILLAGIILTIFVVKNKEHKNYQYYFSVIGYPIFILLTILSSILN